MAANARVNAEAALRALGAQLRQAAAAAEPLRIIGGGSRDFLGRETGGTPLSLAAYSGVIKYRPEEMVVTVRAGTSIMELHQALAAKGQHWRSQPPCASDNSTVGGAVSCGISGPGLPWSGSLRGEVLGVRMLDGRGRLLRFGGEVIKNVAGYDVARWVVGAMGSLGVLLDITLRVFPRPRAVFCGSLRHNPEQAGEYLRRLRAMPLPLAAAACQADAGLLRVRLEGGAGAVAAARAELSLRQDEDGLDWWRQLRDLRLDFFRRTDAPLWLLQRPPGAAPGLPPHSLLDQCGGRVWQYHADMPRPGQGASCIPYRHHDRGLPLWQQGNLPLLRRLKSVLDPHAICNRGRLHPQL